MDIRDELDAMLDNLKSGGAAPRSKSSNLTEKNTAPRKSVYDNMSVDELLTALESEKKSPAPAETQNPKSRTAQNREKGGIPQDLLSILSTGSSSQVSVKKKPKPAPVHASAPVNTDKAQFQPIIEEMPAKIIPEQIVEKTAADIIPESEQEQTAPEILFEPVSAKPITESISEPKEDIPAPKPEFEAVSEPVAEVTAADMLVGNTAPEMPADDAPVPVPKKKRIVINHELPDYEEIRRKALEEAAAESEAKSDEIPRDTVVESNPVAEEGPIPEPVTEADIEAESDDDDDSECGKTSENDIEDEKPVHKHSNGFFAAIKSAFSKKRGVDEASDEESESDDEEASADEETIDEINDISGDEMTEEISAEEEKPIEEDNPIFISEPDASETEEITDFSEDISDNESSGQSESESDPSDSLIADIRKNADIAIASLDESEDKSDEMNISKPETNESAPETEDSLPEAEENSPETDGEIDIQLEKPVRKSRLASALENILDEDPAAISDERSEKNEEDDIDVSLEKSGSGRLKRRLYTAFGVLFTVLAIIGLISSVKFGIAKLQSFTSGESKKDGFIDVIYPAVIMDIESFNTPTELPSEQVITAAIWSIVMSADDMDKYDKTFDVISVPAVDVEAYAAKLFGDNLPTLSHETVGAGDLKFYYNEETKRYNIPVNPISFTYDPKITSVSKNGNDYTVRVDYYKELPSWMEKSENFTNEVSKTVEFRLAEKDGSYTISSMSIVSVNSDI